MAQAGWNHWLDNNAKQVNAIRAKLKAQIDEFSTGTLAGSPFDLGEWEGIPDFKGVTMPNIASLMFMVEEGDKTLLLTGDCQQDFIFAGLERTGFLEPDGHLHVNVLKVQHHGSENNVDADFAQRVSADHYVFCGNGEHKNPDLSVLDIVFDSRATMTTRSSSGSAQPRKRKRDCRTKRTSARWRNVLVRFASAPVAG